MDSSLHRKSKSLGGICSCVRTHVYMRMDVCVCVCVCGQHHNGHDV